MKTYIFIAILLLFLVALSCSYYYYRANNDIGLIAIKGTNKVYHRDNCKFVERANAKDLIFFKSVVHAVHDGYSQCQTCNPPYITLEEHMRMKRQQLEATIKTIQGQIKKAESSLQELAEKESLGIKPRGGVFANILDKRYYEEQKKSLEESLLEYQTKILELPNYK